MVKLTKAIGHACSEYLSCCIDVANLKGLRAIFDGNAVALDNKNKKEQIQSYDSVIMHYCQYSHYLQIALKKVQIACDQYRDFKYTGVEHVYATTVLGAFEGFDANDCREFQAALNKLFNFCKIPQCTFHMTGR